MSDKQFMSAGTEELTTVYLELCQSYRAVDDIRIRLLALLPAITGASVLTLTRGATELPDPKLAAAIGAFGFVVTTALFAYELHGIKKCASLIDAGGLIERELRVHGQFLRRPHEVAGFIDEPFAASLIYPASLASWAYFAVVSSPVVAAPCAAAVFVVGVVGSQWLIRAMEKDLTDGTVYVKEPWWNGRRRPSSPPPRTALVTNDEA